MKKTLIQEVEELNEAMAAFGNALLDTGLGKLLLRMMDKLNNFAKWLGL